MTNKKPGGATHNDIMAGLTMKNMSNAEKLQMAIRLMLTEHEDEAAEIVQAVMGDLVLQVRLTSLLEANAINEVSQILFNTLPPKSGK